MNFALATEQALLQESVRRFCEKEYTFNHRLQRSRDGRFDSETWSRFAEQGWLGVLLPSEVGGSDGSLIESAIIAEEFGRALVVEPYLPCAVMAAAVIDSGASSQHRETLLPMLVSGQAVIAVAHSEAQAKGCAEHVATRATRVARGKYSLSGEKRMVFGGAGVDTFLVSARVEGDVRDRNGIHWFALSRNAGGITAQDYQLLDGRGATTVSLRDVVVGEEALLGEPERIFSALEIAQDLAIVSLCADAVGAMEGALWMTRDYIRNRRAYGATLSTFQALQHRMADMYAEVELSRSVLYAAMAALPNLDASVRRSMISAAKVRVAQGGQFVCGNGIQLHGGMGMADATRVGHYFKRLIVATTLFGNSDQHLRRFQEQTAVACAAH